MHTLCTFWENIIHYKTEGVHILGLTWTPKVCRIIAFYRFWAIILPTFGGLGMNSATKKSRSRSWSRGIRAQGLRGLGFRSVPKAQAEGSVSGKHR